VKVRIGFGLGTAGWAVDERFGGLVDDLERLGFDSLWLSERLTTPTVDPIVGLAFAAGRTRRLKLGTSVLVLPGRNLGILAKELASLDRLAAGRLLLAFGLGVADPSEQQAFGVTRRERSSWFDEALPLLRRLWTEEQVDHQGPRFSYEGLSIQPKPIQQPIEVWLGGSAPSELRRVGRLGDGWLPSLIRPSEAAAARTVVETAAAEAGREIDPEHFGAIVVYAHQAIPPAQVQAIATRRPGVDPAELIPVGLPAARAAVERFVEAGVSKFVVRPASEPADWSAELEQLATSLLPLQTR
jgi:probable F420-dependent oxidoreductase